MRRVTAKNIKNNFPNVLHYYPLQSNSNDSISGLNGTDTGISYVSGGVIGNCADFEVLGGTGNKIVIPDDNSISFVNKDFAFSIWVNYSFILNDAVFGRCSWILNKRKMTDTGTYSTGDEYNLSIVNSIQRIVFLDTINSGLISKISTTTLPSLGVWYNYTITYKSARKTNGLHFYRNGILIGSTSNSGNFSSMVNGTSPLTLGQTSWTSASTNLRFVGKMCEFYIFDGDLSPEQALFVYNEGLAGRDLI